MCKFAKLSAWSLVKSKANILGKGIIDLMKERIGEKERLKELKLDPVLVDW